MGAATPTDDFVPRVIQSQICLQLSPGDEVKVRVLSIDHKTKRISLTMKLRPKL